MDKLTVNEKEFNVLKLLGKGKGGYSYLVEDEEMNKYVLKQIHHEPCDYYSFGNKIQSEIDDYKILSKVPILMPKMIDVDINNERILKEFINGETIYNLILKDKMKDDYITQVKDMCIKLYKNNLNIDYFPTNFVVQDDLIYYIDYECNKYMDKWNFENWGYEYWYKSDKLMEYYKNNK